MALMHIPLDRIDQSQLQALVSGKAEEALTIEYKRETYGGSDTDRGEFLADVSSFANEMVYRINEHQLLRVWSVISSFSRIREIDDPLAQSQILTNAQMLFTAFVFDLQAVDADQTARRAGLGEIVPIAA
jgi:hypothetical protein